MRHYINLIVPGVILVLLFSSCSKDENKIYFEGGTAPVLTASRTDSIPLNFISRNETAVALSWTNPDYKFTTGVSSQNVNYQIEIDTTGAEFTSPKKHTISVSSNLSRTVLQSELNDILLNQLVLAVNVPHSIQMRVKSFLGSSAVMLTSNALQFTVTPYAIPPKVTPPASGQLFIVGSATPGGWDNPVPVPSQEFTKITETMYEISIALTGGGSYLMLPVNGSWDAKYGAIGSNNTNNVNGDDFKAGGGDLLAPPASRSYKISVDFQRGKFTVTPI